MLDPTKGGQDDRARSGSCSRGQFAPRLTETLNSAVIVSKSFRELKSGISVCLHRLQHTSTRQTQQKTMGWFSGSNNDDSSSSTIDLTSSGGAPISSPITSLAGSSPKAQLMQQIQQQAAMANARALVTVRHCLPICSRP